MACLPSALLFCHLFAVGAAASAALPATWKDVKFTDLKLYVLPGWNLTANCDYEHPYTSNAKRVPIPQESLLSPVKDWLWKHDEYISVDFLLHLVACGMQRVKNKTEADLCYPHCYQPKLHEWKGRYSGQLVEIKASLRGKVLLHNCIAFQVHMEAAWPMGMSRCHIVVPYFHGIYRPTGYTGSVTPWNLGNKRDLFLAFFGGRGRGTRCQQTCNYACSRARNSLLQPLHVALAQACCFLTVARTNTVVPPYAHTFSLLHGCGTHAGTR